MTSVCFLFHTCWRKANLNVLSEPVDVAEGFDELVFSILNQEDELVASKFIMVCWSIWR